MNAPLQGGDSDSGGHDRVGRVEPPSRPALRSWLLRIAQIALAVGVIAYLFRSDRFDPRSLARAAERWPWWLAAQACFGAGLFAMTLRWHTLLRIHRLDVRLRDTASLALIGFSFNQLAPGATGGDIAKAVAIAAEHPDRRAAALLSIAIDRILGLITLAGVVLVASLADVSHVLGSPGPALLALIAAGTVTGGLFAMAAVMWSPLRRLLRIDYWLERLASVRWLAGVSAALDGYHRSPRLLAAATGWSVLLHTMTIATNLCLAFAVFGAQVSIPAVVSVVPMVHFAAGVPLTLFGNLGVFEVLYEQLLASAGITDGAAVGLMQRSVFWTWALVGAALLIVRRMGAPRTPLAAAQPET